MAATLLLVTVFYKAFTAISIAIRTDAVESELMVCHLEASLGKLLRHECRRIDKNIIDMVALFTDEVLVVLDERIKMLRPADREHLELSEPH